LAIEAAQHMAAFAFDTLRCPLLTAVRHPDNLASGRVMDRLGMHYRGLEHWYDSELAVHEIDALSWAKRQRPGLLPSETNVHHGS
jgi:RimJ/RimL family protein N-acetyltransferase